MPGDRADLGDLWLDHVNALLNPATPVNDLGGHLKRMQDHIEFILGSQLAGLSKKWTQLETGCATSPADAINCFPDTMRTMKYLRGVHQAILDLQEIFPGERLHVVYAGCGPFAPLALPLCALFPPKALSITLIDIHEESLDAAEQLAKAMGVTASINNYLCEDASAYRFPKDVPIHMLVTETLVNGLTKEGHVSIVHNFSGQIQDRGILIPENIIIDARYVLPEVEYRALPPNPVPGMTTPRTKEIQSRRIPLGRLFEVSLETARTWSETASRDRENHLVLPANSIYLPERLPAGYTFTLFTELIIYKDIVIKEYESGLTHPLSTNFHPLSNHLSFCYVMNGTPSLYILEKGALRSLFTPDS